MAHRGGKKIKTVAFVSLGCPKNLVDSERMLGLLAEDGLAITADHSAADAIVVNTCGFLEASKEESLAEIRRAVAMKQKGNCEHVVEAVRGQENPRQEHGHFLGKYHDLSKELARDLNPESRTLNPPKETK